MWAAIKREALPVAAGSGPDLRGSFEDCKGPFELMDVVGLDVVLDIEEHYAHARYGISTVPRKYPKGRMAEEKLGEKNGRGFYEYFNDLHSAL